MPPDCEERPGADRSREQVFEDRFDPLLNGSSLHKAPNITSTTNPWIGDELPIHDNTDLALSDHSENRSDVNILSAGLDVEHHHKILMNRKKRRILASSGNFSLVCKICSKEFSTGRALGGHMRIHSNNSSKSEESESEEESEEEEEEEEEANWSVISDQMNEKKKRRRRKKKKQKNRLDLDMAEGCYVNRPHESNLMDEEEETIVHNFDYQTTHPNHNYSNQSIHGVGDKLFCVDQFGMIHNSNKQTDMEPDQKTKKKTKKKKKYYYMSKEYSHEHGDDLQDRNRSAGFASETNDQETLVSGKAEEKKKKQKKQKKDEPAQENMDHDHKGGRISRNGSNICPVCSRDFMSQKALFGHMRSHPERQWRGIQPPAPALLPAHQDNDRLSHDSNPNGSTADLSVSDKSSPTGSSSASSHHHHHIMLMSTPAPLISPIPPAFLQVFVFCRIITTTTTTTTTTTVVASAAAAAVHLHVSHGLKQRRPLNTLRDAEIHDMDVIPIIVTTTTTIVGGTGCTRLAAVKELL